ncbi:MAG: hypothetical protein V1773_12840 [bacterium]
MKHKKIQKEKLLEKATSKILLIALSGKAEKMADSIKNDPQLQKLQSQLDTDIKKYKEHSNNVVIDDDEYIKTFFNY